MRRHEGHAVPDPTRDPVRRTLLRVLLTGVVLLILLAPRPSAADESSAAGQQRAFLDLVVNDVPMGEVFVLVR